MTITNIKEGAIKAQKWYNIQIDTGYAVYIPFSMPQWRVNKSKVFEIYFTEDQKAVKTGIKEFVPVALKRQFKHWEVIE